MSSFTDFLIHPSWCGLDIGLRSLKIVQIENDSSILSVKIDIPENSFSHEGVKDKIGLAKLIRAGLDHAYPRPIKAKFAFSALPESLVFSKFVNIPVDTSKEIDQFAIDQANKSFPISSNEIHLDWQFTGKEDGQETEIIIVATPKNIVNDLIETAAMAGLEILGIETKPIAICRTFFDKKYKDALIIIDIGAQKTTISCVETGLLRLVSSVSIGGDDMLKDINKSAEILNTEIDRTLSYYQNKISSAKIFRKIILAGGGANIHGIAEAVEKATKTRTIIGSPTLKMKNYNPEFAVAIGLAQNTIS